MSGSYVVKKSTVDKLITVFSGTGMAILNSLLVMSIFYFVFPEVLDYPRLTKEPYTFYWFIVGCGLAPLFEELVFRYLPLQIAKRLATNANESSVFHNIQWHLLGFSSIVFGLMHGNLTNVVVQGITGFIFGWIHIKNNYCYWSAVLAHQLYNLFMMFIIPSLIQGAL